MRERHDDATYSVSALGKQQERLPKLVEYACLPLPLDFEADDAKVNQAGAFTDASPESVVVVQTSLRHFRFMPGPEFCPRLYRGQNRYYEPCVSSLYRNQEPTDIIALVAWNLRRLRVQQGISQEKLAADAAVDRAYLGAWSGKKKTPTVDLLDRIAEALAITTAGFFVKPEPGAHPPASLKGGCRPAT